MWREPEYQDEKEENRKAVLVRKEHPKSYLDMLSIIEHPAFQQFYDELLSDGLAGVEENDISNSSITGDLIKVGLKENYENYDLFWPVIIREAEDEMTATQIDINALESFTLFPLEQLRKFLAAEGETFYSEAILSSTTFGKYEVKADLFTAASYNEYLQKMLRTITMRVNRVGGKALPSLQINEMEIVRIVDLYIRTKLFNQPFNPFAGNDWKILLSKNAIVTQHIIKVMSIAIHKMQENVTSHEALVEKRWFSSVPVLRMRESFSMALQKVIYERMNYPSSKGELEKRFMEFLDKDADVQRFLKINESQHDFAKGFYIREDGLLASYHPDFMVCTEDGVYIVETKGNDKINDANVRRKQLSLLEWCKKLNRLPSEDRMNRTWSYMLLSEDNFYTWSANGATFNDIARLSCVSTTAVTGLLF